VNFVMRVAHLNDAVFEKNKQLEASLGQLKQFHQKLAALMTSYETIKGFSVLA